MWVQLALGAAILAVAVALQALAIGIASRVQGWIQRSGRRPSDPHMVLLVIGMTLWMLSGQVAGAFVWAGAFRGLGAFEDFEHSLYFALVAYTTLGFGDALLPEEWRLLGALTAANGMIGFGLATAYMVRFLTAVRAH